MKLQAFFFFFSGVAWAWDCNNVQLGSTQPCEYSTSNCTSGVIQWNYPTHNCLWTFAPKGANTVALRATWRTAADVNVSFYDGPGAGAKLLEKVIGGDSDDAQANVVSQTGTVFVKLEGPPSMMTYALIFDYTLTINPSRCANFNAKCPGCLNAGCSMLSDGTCVDSCPTDIPCWRPGSPSQATCADRTAFLAAKETCESRGTCESCLEGGQCKWGGPVGSQISCHATCEGMQKCKFYDTCPNAQVCSNQTTCEGCLKVGCSVIGLQGVNCVPECPTDVECFRADSRNCKARRDLLAKTGECESQSDCSSCLQHGCAWNKLGVNGQMCIPHCGFFPCEQATQCDAASTAQSWWTMIVSFWQWPARPGTQPPPSVGVVPPVPPRPKAKGKNRVQGSSTQS